MRRFVETVFLTAAITVGVYLGLTLRAVTAHDSSSSCVIERIDAEHSRTTCD